VHLVWFMEEGDEKRHSHHSRTKNFWRNEGLRYCMMRNNNAIGCVKVM